jgi:hypothetical protein
MLQGLSTLHKRHSDAAAWLMQFERTLALDIGGRKASPKTVEDQPAPVLVVPSTKGGIASPH